jgi:predicted small secreted protein
MKIVLTLILVTALAACSTVAGVGKDIQSSAEWTKEKMGGSK